MTVISGNRLQNRVTKQLNMISRIDRLNMIIQRQFMSIETGYVRAVISTELLR